MSLLAQILIGLVTLIHIYIVVLETVWFKGRGRKVFGLSKEQADQVAPAMLNQGFYNAFLVAALCLGLFATDPTIARAFCWFGLSCVAVAGIVGAVSVQRRILFVQTVPACAAMLALYLG